MCLHTRTIVTQEDESVCTECGLVTEKVYNDKSSYPYMVDECDDEFTKQQLLDVFHNHHIPLSLVLPVLNKYKKSRIDPRLSKFSNNEILAYQTFIELIDNEVSRTPTEVAYYYQVGHLQLWRIGLCLEKTDRVNSQDLLLRYGNELRLPFNMNPAILSVIHEMEQFTCAKPETVVASAIFVSLEKRGESQDVKAHSLAEIARTCSVSQTSVRSLVKRYLKIKS